MPFFLNPFPPPTHIQGQQSTTIFYYQPLVNEEEKNCRYICTNHVVKITKSAAKHFNKEKRKEFANVSTLVLLKRMKNSLISAKGFMKRNQPEKKAYKNSKIVLIHAPFFYTKSNCIT